MTGHRRALGGLLCLASLLGIYGWYRSRQDQLPQLGIFLGPSLLDVVPLEIAQPAVNAQGAWPAANPVGSGLAVGATISLVSAGGQLFAFYEEAGRITAAESANEGVTWKPLGVVLGAEPLLSAPAVLLHENTGYLVASDGKAVLLYSTKQFPKGWQLVKALTPSPLHSLSLFQHNASWWLLGSRPGAGPGGGDAMEVFRSTAGPQGAFAQQFSGTVPASMLGQVVTDSNGSTSRLLRLGRPCSGAVCGDIAAFELTLSPGSYQQRQLPAAAGRPLLQRSQQRSAWDSARHGHADMLRLPTGRWLIMAAGYSEPAEGRSAAARLVQVLPTLLLTLTAGLLLAATANLPEVQRLAGHAAWGRPLRSRVLDAVPIINVSASSAPLKRYADRGSIQLGGKSPFSWQPTKQRRGRGGLSWRGLALPAAALLLLLGSAAAQLAKHTLAPYLVAAQPAAVDGLHSKFTLMVMSYDKRLESLKYYIKHYSKCPSVGEILVVWNKGTPPDPLKDLPSPVPVRVRVEKANSMNNRYRPDPEIKFRAVLSLDDDIMMPCTDIERAFASWRAQPHTIVGWYPRLVREGTGGRLGYHWEDSTVAHGQYNAILTGAAFLDSSSAFELYWAPAVAPARQLVDTLVNCDDLLMNFVVANASRAAREGGGTQQPAVIEFQRPQRRVDISYLTSTVGLSHNWDRFKSQAEHCLGQFVNLFGGNPLQTRHFDWSQHKKPFCGVQVLGCLYL